MALCFKNWSTEDDVFMSYCIIYQTGRCIAVLCAVVADPDVVEHIESVFHIAVLSQRAITDTAHPHIQGLPQ